LGEESCINKIWYILKKKKRDKKKGEKREKGKKGKREKGKKGKREKEGSVVLECWLGLVCWCDGVMECWWMSGLVGGRDC
jgi:hypothetical protein